MNKKNKTILTKEQAEEVKKTKEQEKIISLKKHILYSRLRISVSFLLSFVIALLLAASTFAYILQFKNANTGVYLGLFFAGFLFTLGVISIYFFTHRFINKNNEFKKQNLRNMYKISFLLTFIYLITIIMYALSSNKSLVFIVFLIMLIIQIALSVLLLYLDTKKMFKYVIHMNE